MVIRPALIEDISAILKIEQQAEAAAHWTEEKYREIFENETPGRSAESAAPRRIMMVAEDEAGVQGFGIMRLMRQECEIENLVVAPEMRRRGVGKQLLRTLIDLARKQGVITVFLEVRDGNDAARALYNGVGFRESGRRRAYYHSPREDAILYQL
ncbi:MAG: ribosomal protein S18-alanine N-acetyltransferase [Terriglobales bacterium]|nr:ribosomal protein S18-alanine N-acetyltransferase [Terriglobales bacterium]